jgi:cytochrome c-type biogenesis protein
LNLVNLAVSFGAGLISITSPCCLPLLPGYLGYLTGMSSSEQLAANRRRTVAAALLFVAGFSIVFIALGATASVLGTILMTNRLPLARIAGGFILLMGLVLLFEGQAGLLSRGGDWSRWALGGRLWTAPLLGVAFAITWTPCIGPVLAVILTLAGSTASLQQGVVLLAAYSLGLAVPFVALSLSVPRVRSWLQRVRRGPAILQTTAGAFLVFMGVLLVMDRWLQLISPVLSWYAQARWPPI